ASSCGTLAADARTSALSHKVRWPRSVEGGRRRGTAMRESSAREPLGTPAGTPERGHQGVITERPPLAHGAALRALIGCAARTARLLRRRRMHLPARHVGTRLRFADGTSARVYRETVVDRGATGAPCVVVVEVRLRGARGRGDCAYCAEGLLMTT